MEKIEKRNFIGMIGINACFRLLGIFVSVFLVAQVFFVTGYDLMAVALFLLVEVVTLFVFYFLSSWICKKIRAIWVVRVATFLLCVFLFLTIIWEDGLYSHYMLFGLMWGMVVGLYWGAMNFLIAKVFDKEKIMRYFVFKFVMNAVVGIVFPFTFGFAIDVGSWFVTGTFVLIVATIQLMFTFLVKTGMQESRKLQLRKYFCALKERSHFRPALNLWFVIFMAGFPYTLPALMTILIIFAYGSNIGIGVMGSIFAAVGVCALLIYRRSSDKAKTPVFFVASTLPLLASIALFFYVGPLSVILFNLFLVFPQNIVNVEEQNTRINATRYWGGEEYIIESHLFYEFALMIGRVLSCGLLLLIAWLGSTQALLATAISLILIAYFVHAMMLFIWKRRNI